MAVNTAREHYLTPNPDGEDIIIANTYAKANESIMIGLHTAFKAVGESGSDVVLISNAPDGQVTHYLLGIFGRTTRANLPLTSRVPENVRHVIVYSEYHDIAGRVYIEQSDKVSFTDKWSDVVAALEGWNKPDARVAVLPSSEIQYFA